MDQLTEILKHLSPAEVERLLVQVRQTQTVDRTNEASGTPFPSGLAPSSTAEVPNSDGAGALPPPPPTNEEEPAEPPREAAPTDVPLAELFGSSTATAELAAEVKARQQEERLKKEAEKALERERQREEKARKDTEKALEKERQMAKKAKRELERALSEVRKDEVRERQQVEKDEKHDSQKLFKDAKEEGQRLEKEAEREQTRLQKVEEARQAAAAKASANQPTTSLASFGFFAQTAKQPTEAASRLFPLFVPDRRVVPAALRFWQRPGEGKEATIDEEEASVMVTAGPLHTAPLPCVDEESSLMHAPVGAHIEVAVPVPDVQWTPPHKISFNEMIESVGAGSQIQHCPCAYHTQASIPLGNFDSEVVFAGFYAIGYDPCQSRPPYFGTLNHLQEGNLNAVELLRLGRFPTNQSMPRLSTLDYEYDSGDDWDVLEDDEDIAASSSDSDGVADASDSSDSDFIDDYNDDSDPDRELQQKIMEARQSRMHRLAGKDKLIPSYSGPFVGVHASEHPLSHCDRLDRFKALDDAFFESMLEVELTRLECTTTHGVDSEAKREQKLLEAALKNRREMLKHELEAMHKLIEINSKVAPKTVAEMLLAQHLCVGVARAEITRSIKRFYERKHGMLTRREEPWAATDDRLFMKSADKKAKASPNSKDDEVAAKDEQDNDADDEGGSDAEQSVPNRNSEGAAPSPPAAPTNDGDSPKCPGPTILELMDRKRSREDVPGGAETEIIAVVATEEATTPSGSS